MLLPEIINVLVEWKNECGAQTLGTKTTYKDDKHYLTIFTDKPGYLIGKQGCLIDKYKKKLKEVASERYDDIEIVQVEEFISFSDKVDVDAYYEKHFNFVGEL